MEGTGALWAKFGLQLIYPGEERLIGESPAKHSEPKLDLWGWKYEEKNQYPSATVTKKLSPTLHLHNLSIKQSCTAQTFWSSGGRRFPSFPQAFVFSSNLVKLMVLHMKESLNTSEPNWKRTQIPLQENPPLFPFPWLLVSEQSQFPKFFYISLQISLHALQVLFNSIDLRFWD